MARPLLHEWRVEATIWPTKANQWSASPTYKAAKKLAAASHPHPL